ncbi:MAG: pilus assembly protein [Lachnospiraceae bacterium]|nr:pilus assembly protein [Lachnospiraceae bacterium]
MSFCRRREHHAFPEPENLHCNQNRKFARTCCKRASLCTRQKGSYTLEAAVILPLMAGFFVAILFFFRVIQIQTQVQEALIYASRKTACEASAVESPIALRASAEAFFRKELSKYELPDKYIKGGNTGISLLRSDMSKQYIDIQADYFVKLPINFFFVKGIEISQASKSRKWTGDCENGCVEDYVYVTETGVVYHRNRNCSYLDLTIQAVNSAETGGLRNKSGHKYYACAECAANCNTPSVVYITDYGTCYHASLSCSGLKRTVYMISISDVGARGPCSKCGAQKGE